MKKLFFINRINQKSGSVNCVTFLLGIYCEKLEIPTLGMILRISDYR
jgi:hypothetical protein